MLKFYNRLKISKRKIFVSILSLTFVSIIIIAINLAVSNQPNLNKEESKISEDIQEENKVVDAEPNNNKVEEENGSHNETVMEKSYQQECQQENPNTKDVDYKNLYPNLYCSRPKEQITPSDKTIFLTFDDGPSDRTSEILEILRQKNVKATFFVTRGNGSAKVADLMRQIVNEGHTIAIHTYSHEFKQIYSSVNSFLDDFNKIYNLIYENTGIKPTIFRFPGGSKNSFNKNNYKELIAEMTRRGFDYFDWNLSAGDAVSRTPTPTQNCISNVLNYSKNCSHGVVLMHDASPKTTTVKALPDIIDGLKNQGFKFDKLSNNINPASYSLCKPYR